MRKKWLSSVLAFALALSLAPCPAFAAGFADVTDAATAQNVEVLRLMGVIEGDGNGSFRPNSSLTRAEFCKMTIVLQGRADQVVRYASRTIFPDVRASHWAAGYINLATTASGESTPGLMHGFPNGTFLPDKTISGAEAVTVLMRALGYSDTDTGGVWPDGYLQLARETGMTKGLSLGGGEITRAQAAQLFVNALTAKDGSGVTLLSKLGYTADLNADPVTLWSVDEAKGVLRTSDKTTPTVTMAKPMASTALNGLKGHVVTNSEKKAVTFLPATSAAGGSVSDAAVIVGANGSNVGVAALTGGATNYALYRNGIRSTADALRKYDVLIYDASSNTVEACDTRIAAYYEGCEPSQSAPTTITTLGGTTFAVIPSAQQSLSQFKPGDSLVFLLAADGRIAGAVAAGTSGASGNALGYVDADGKLNLICGAALKQLAGAYGDYAGQAVSISQSKFLISVSRQNSGATGVLDLTKRTLGGRKLADGVVVYRDGVLTSVETLGAQVDPNRIAYARTNGAGEVELIVIAERGNVLYGRAVVQEEDDEGTTVRYVAVKSPSGTSSAIQTIFSARTNEYIEAVVANGKYTSITALTRLSSVPASAWVGDTALNYGGQTYTVYPDSVICWNRDSGAWFSAPSDTETALDAARDYGGRMDVYVKDGVVRVVEVYA